MTEKQQKKQTTPAPVADVAAEVNAAPETPQEALAVASDTPPEKRNRWREMFESVHFEPKDGTVYENNDGSKSKQIASGIAVFTGGFGGVLIKVSARTKKGSKAVTADCNFIGTRTTNAIKSLDAAAEAELAEFRAWMADEYAAWRALAGSAANVKALGSVEIEGLEL
jgi:hypothetical protein